MKNLVLGTSVNFNPLHLQNIVKSFREVNQVDDFVLFCDQQSLDTMGEFFKQHNVIAFTTEWYQFIDTYIHNIRYLVYLEYLTKNTEYKNVFMADTKDVIFQSDPFCNLPDEYIYFFKEDSGFVIKDDQEYNAGWIRIVFGNEELEKIHNNNIVCSGTILGSRNETLKFLKLMKFHLLEHKRKNPRMFPGYILDQGITNYIAYNDLTLKKTLKNNGDIVGTLAITVTQSRAQDRAYFENDKLMVNGQCPVILHQYDRRPDIFEFYHKKYGGGRI